MRSTTETSENSGFPAERLKMNEPCNALPAAVCDKYCRRGSIDQLRDRLRSAQEEVERLSALIAKVEKNPEVADLLNEISKVL